VSVCSEVIRAALSAMVVCCRDRVNALSCDLVSREMVGYCVYILFNMCRICPCVDREALLLLLSVSSREVVTLQDLKYE